MKTKTLFIGLLIVLLASCTSPLSNRMNDYVDKVEDDCQSWTEQDWELSQAEYAKLLEEYEQNYESYSPEERDAINKAIGRYNGILVKKGLKKVDESINDFIDRLPSLFEGFMSAFEEESENYETYEN